MPRLFTALEVPTDVRMSLTGLRGGLRGARWIEPENYHITLRFIGDVDDRTADDVADALDRVHAKNVRIHLQGLGSFGSKKPHSVWARVSPDRNLMELQAEHERVLQKVGLEPERRRYTPHVTVARLKGASPVEVASWLAVRGDFSARPYAAPRFVLMSSKASVGGGPYIVEESYALRIAEAA